MRAVGRMGGVGVCVIAGTSVGTLVAVAIGTGARVGMTVGIDEGEAVGASIIGALEESIPESKARLATTMRRNARTSLGAIVHPLRLNCFSQIIDTEIVRWSLADGAAFVHDATCPFNVHVAIPVK